MRQLNQTELQSVSGADGGLPGPGRSPHFRVRGNNGFGNNGGDPAPGNSGTNGSPNAEQKLLDEVR